MGSVVEDRYEIIRAVTSGGMGSVYEARDRNGGGRCAIKKMLEHLLQGDEATTFQAKFESETTFLRNLRHPGIPRLVDSFDRGGIYYIVMEFIQGPNLEQELAERGRFTGAGFPAEILVNDACQVLDILVYLHGQDPPLVHRDIKPANLIREYPSGKIKLVDFGLARSLTAGKTQTQIGTLGYSPLEQLQGHAEPRSDLYALGVTMHHLYTGLEPTPLSIPKVSTVRPEAEPFLADIIDQACAHRPQDRFLNAGTMLSALREWQRRHAGATADPGLDGPEGSSNPRVGFITRLMRKSGEELSPANKTRLRPLEELETEAEGPGEQSESPGPEEAPSGDASPSPRVPPQPTQPTEPPEPSQPAGYRELGSDPDWSSEAEQQALAFEPVASGSDPGPTRKQIGVVVAALLLIGTAWIAWGSRRGVAPLPRPSETAAQPNNPTRPQTRPTPGQVQTPGPNSTPSAQSPGATPGAATPAPTPSARPKAPATPAGTQYSLRGPAYPQVAGSKPTTHATSTGPGAKPAASPLPIDLARADLDLKVSLEPGWTNLKNTRASQSRLLFERGSGEAFDPLQSLDIRVGQSSEPPPRLINSFRLKRARWQEIPLEGYALACIREAYGKQEVEALLLRPQNGRTRYYIVAYECRRGNWSSDRFRERAAEVLASIQVGP